MCHINGLIHHVASCLVPSPSVVGSGSVPRAVRVGGHMVCVIMQLRTVHGAAVRACPGILLSVSEADEGQGPRKGGRKLGSQRELWKGAPGAQPGAEEVGAQGRAQGAGASRPAARSWTDPHPHPRHAPPLTWPSWPSPVHWGREEQAGWGPVLASSVARTPRVAFITVNNGPTGLAGLSPWGPRGRHADPTAGGSPALRPPGDPRSRLPSTAVQVSGRTALCTTAVCQA